MLHNARRKAARAEDRGRHSFRRHHRTGAAAHSSHPPDILVTTPESLYLLLTSKAGRILGTVDTVIVDEIHAVAGTKRGAHLAVSLERLENLVTESRKRDAIDADADEAVMPPSMLAVAIVICSALVYPLR